MNDSKMQDKFNFKEELKNLVLKQFLLITRHQADPWETYVDMENSLAWMMVYFFQSGHAEEILQTHNQAIREIYFEILNEDSKSRKDFETFTDAVQAEKKPRLS